MVDLMISSTSGRTWFDSVSSSMSCKAFIDSFKSDLKDLLLYFFTSGRYVFTLPYHTSITFHHFSCKFLEVVSSLVEEPPLSPWKIKCERTQISLAKSYLDTQIKIKKKKKKKPLTKQSQKGHNIIAILQQ